MELLYTSLVSTKTAAIAQLDIRKSSGYIKLE